MRKASRNTEGADDSDSGRGWDVEPRCGNCLQAQLRGHLFSRTRGKDLRK